MVRTRKYALSKRHYISLAYAGIVRRQGIWILLAYVLLNAPAWEWPSWWWLIGSSVALVLYLLFWLLQFAGVTYLEQSKLLFERLSYEIDSRQILIKRSAREGMPIPWEKIKRVHLKKEAFIFYLNTAQLIYLPFRVFQSQHDIKVVETLLHRKNYIRSK